MTNRPSRVNLFAWVASLLVLTLLVFLCVRYLDVPVARFVQEHFYVKEQWSRLTSDLPDLLLHTVVSVTILSLVLYRVRVACGIHDCLTSLARLVAWAAPTSYLMKALFKFVFGRVNTRVWLQQPDLYGFHWFQGLEGCEGFPSGHMVVIVALLSALWRCYPKSRPLAVLLALAFGGALVATDYHFLSDVLAGSWLGVLVEALVFRFLPRRPLHPGNPAA